MAGASTATTARFGTLGGVFTPCTLTILGVIMFLRFGQVVGNAGIWHAITIVLAAKAITTITALSLSAIATNTKVKGGGAYYLISRSLGVEFGGSIGIVFFLSQALSVAMYVIGFTEALVATFPSLAGNERALSTAVNVGVLACVYIGAGWTIKLQYGILVALLAAIVAFFAGAFEQASLTQLEQNWGPAYLDGQGWLVMFALFFPAATGIMAGANMSGDLADPGRSIPRGTLLAILFTGAIYVAFAVMLGMSADRAVLQQNPMVVRELALSDVLITVGVFAATLSSALGSMMGAPRILQALARDRVFPILNPFAQGSGRNQEPRLATLLSFAIAEGGILLGDLDAVAPIITMFFMITYGALNLATFTEALSGNPSYRPTFRWCHWSLALLGALGCLSAMILIDAVWAAVAIVVMALLYQYLQRQDIQANFAAVHGGAAFERARRNLITLEEERYHPKNWRPAILVLGAGNEERLHLAIMTRWLAGPRGLLFLGHVILGSPEAFLERQRAQQRLLRKFIAEHELEAFPAVTVAQRFTDGVISLVQCCGIGALRPNMAVLGWSDDPERRANFAATIRVIHQLGRSIGILRVVEDESDPWQVPEGTIDLWWRGEQNGALMLLLAHLMRQNAAFGDTSIRLLRLLPNVKGQTDTLAHLEQLTRDARISADCQICIGDDFRAALRRESAGAALVVLGFRPPDEDDGGQFLNGLDVISRGLPNVLLVCSAGDMNLQA